MQEVIVKGTPNIEELARVVNEIVREILIKKGEELNESYKQDEVA